MIKDYINKAKFKIEFKGSLKKSNLINEKLSKLIIVTGYKGGYTQPAGRSFNFEIYKCENCKNNLLIQGFAYYITGKEAEMIFCSTNCAT